MARVNFGQLFFTNSTKVKDNKKHHKVHIINFSNLFSNFPGLNSFLKVYIEVCVTLGIARTAYSESEGCQDDPNTYHLERSEVRIIYYSILLCNTLHQYSTLFFYYIT